jgi:hypothetical protein
VEISPPPYRWDLVRPDQLGAVPDASGTVRFPYPRELTVAAGKVTARSGGGLMFFVGRSPDSLFDLLSGAFDGVRHAPGLRRLDYSGRSEVPVRPAREVLARQGLTPRVLARGRAPVALVDLVSEGGTFTALHHLLRDWADDEREPWDVIRRKVRFVGLTWRDETSPKAYRWWRQYRWPATYPARSVINVAVDGYLWSYLGNAQSKLTGSFPEERWAGGEADGPRHDPRTRMALAEATGIVALGRAKKTRSLLVRTWAAEPAYGERWLRALISEMGS